MNWKKFDGPALVASKGVKCQVVVRGPGRPDATVAINAHGQPIVRDTGMLLDYVPTEYREVAEAPADNSSDKPADAPADNSSDKPADAPPARRPKA